MDVELAVKELNWYRDKQQHLRDLDERLEEVNEEYLRFPHTYYDEELGQIDIINGSIENAVIWKIQVEEALVKARERIMNRCSSIEQALSELNPEQQELLRITYLNEQDSKHIQKLLSYKEMKLLQVRVRQALLTFYNSIVRQRDDRHKAKRAAFKQAIEQKVQCYLERGTVNA